MSLICFAEAVETAYQSYLVLWPAVISQPVVPVPVVVQVVLAWCPFTQWEQHFANKTSKNCSLRGEATIFINRPKSIKPTLNPIKPNLKPIKPRPNPNPYPIKPNLNPISPNLNPIKPNANPNPLKPNP